MVTIVIHGLNLKVTGLWSGYIIMQKMIMVSKFLSGLRKSSGGLNMGWFFSSPIRRNFFCQRMVSVKQTRSKLRLELFLNSLIGHISVPKLRC